MKDEILQINKTPTKRKAVAIGIVCSIFVFLFCIIGLMHLKSQAEMLQRESTAEELMRLARVLAHKVDMGLHAKVVKEKDTESELYKAAIEPLLTTHLNIPEIEFIYTFVADSKNMYLILDTGNFGHLLERDHEPVEVGEIYTSNDPNEDLLLHSSLLIGKPYQSKGVVKDKHGEFFTVVYPIPNQNRAPTFAGVGIDISKDVLNARIDKIQAATSRSILWIGAIAIGCGLFTGLVSYRFERANFETTREKFSRIRTEKEKSILAVVAQKSPSGIVLCDPEGRITWVNSRFSELTGYALEEIKGEKPGHVLQTEKASKNTINALSHATKNGKKIKTEILNKKKSGEIYWASIEIEPFKSENKIKYWIGVHEDVTSRIQKEQELKEAKERAESSSRAKSEFLAVMSHEIRTPLNGVLGSCQLLQKTNPNEEQKEYLGYIESCGASLMDTIEEILDFSKIEAGKCEPDYEDFIPSELLESILPIHSSTAHRNKTKIDVSFEENCYNTFHGERNKLSQVLNNIIGNAVKFTKNGSVGVKCSVNERNLIVLVEDTGKGIEEDKKLNLFEPFLRGDSSHTREHGGTGLGLTISKKLTDFCGGKLEMVKSDENGTIFKILFPLKKAIGKKNGTPVGEPLLKNRVLLVEDNHINQKIARIILKKKNQDVTCVANGAEAVVEAKKSVYDFILMDIQMPVMDGIEATREIRSFDTEIPIIALTATVEATELHRGLSEGMNEFVTKPFKEESLDKIIRKYGKKVEKC